jgi:transcriptional regulator with XRE-family HTH domain
MTIKVKIDKSPLYNLRIINNLTAREASTRLGISEKHLRNLECGEKKVTLALAKLLDLGIYEKDKKTFIGKSLMRKHNNWIQRKHEKDKEKSN